MTCIDHDGYLRQHFHYLKNSLGSVLFILSTIVLMIAFIWNPRKTGRNCSVLNMLLRYFINEDNIMKLNSRDNNNLFLCNILWFWESIWLWELFLLHFSLRLWESTCICESEFTEFTEFYYNSTGWLHSSFPFCIPTIHHLQEPHIINNGSNSNIRINRCWQCANVPNSLTIQWQRESTIALKIKAIFALWLKH